MAGNRGFSLGQPTYEIGQGLNCIFGGIASAFEAIDVAQKSGTLTDIEVDLKSCSARAISQIAPVFSENPIEDSAEFAFKQFIQLTVVTFAKSILPKGPLTTTIYPSSTPAYPGPWRNR